jgi:hypothetical protein
MSCLSTGESTTRKAVYVAAKHGLAGTITFLYLDAADQITGTTICVDGVGPRSSRHEGK